MHILILPSWYPAYPEDIRGCFFRDQALALLKAGNQVGVVANEFRSLKNWKTIFSCKHGFFYENDSGINTIRFKTMLWFPKVPFLINTLNTVFGKQGVEKYVEKYGKPDIIHVHSCLYMGEIAQYIKTKYQINYIVTEHSSGYIRDLYTPYQLQVTKEILNNSSCNIAVSSQMAKFFMNKFETSSKWEVVPNIVNPIFFEKKLEERKSNNNRFKFINVAFMNENKRQINIVKAYHKLIQQGFINIELDLIGEGEEKSALEKYVKDNMLTNINFLGLKDRYFIAEAMSKSDCFILSSNFETFGVVIIESLASGLPVISTKCGGPEDILVEENGLLVEKNNIAELAEAMVTMLSSKYDKNKIRRSCYEQYSEEAVTMKLKYIYQKFVV